MEKFEIAILLPVYNEEATLEKLLKKIKRFGTAVVVNDGSVDSSGNIAKKHTKHYLFHKKNFGYDAALNTGFNYIKKKKFKYMITFDADGQHKVKYIKKIIHWLSNKSQNYDFVCAERKKFLRFSEKLYSVIFNHMYKIKDPLCGLKGYNVLKFKKKKLFSFFKTFGTEMILYAANNSFKIKTFRISVKKRQDQSRLGNNLRSNFFILNSLIALFIYNYVFKK